MKIKGKQKGFTLVELLVVMVIIGILSVIMAPSFLDFQRKTKLNESVQTVKALMAEGFSSSRSKSRVYKVDMEPTKVSLSSYGYTDCCVAVDHCDFTTSICTGSAESILSEDFLGTVKLTAPSAGLITYFIPPHGDIYQGTGTHDIKLEDDHGNAQEFILYQKSGLISQ